MLHCGERRLSHRFLSPSRVNQQVAFLILSNCSCHCSSNFIVRKGCSHNRHYLLGADMPCTMAVSQVLHSSL